MKGTKLVSLGIIFLMFCLGAYFYNSLPEKIASHWNAEGQVNGYMSKNMALIFIPGLTLVLYGFFRLIPRIDPLKKNIAAFAGYYDNFVLAFTAFMLYIYCVTLVLNLGYGLSINSLLTPAMAALIFYTGVLLEKSRRNWFIGVRTPWTLSSDVVWDKTNKLGGKLFKVVGLFILLGIFLPNLLVYVILAPVLLVSLGLVVYSYVEYQKVGKA